jgi:hypothetical protein
MEMANSLAYCQFEFYNLLPFWFNCLISKYIQVFPDHFFNLGGLLNVISFTKCNESKLIYCKFFY